MALLIKTTGIEDYLDPEGGGAWIKTLIIGGHGVGKTPFGAFWPKPIFAACEDGMMSVARLNVPYAEIHSNTDMDAFILRMRQECAKPLAKRQWFTVVVDTIDSYQRRLMQQRTRDMNLDRFTGWDNWDWLDAQFQKMINAFTNLPMHLVINLHHKEGMVGEGDDKSLVRTARLKGDSKESIFQDFDLIGFMETYYEAVGGERVRRRHIRWWPEPGFEFVRDRSNQLPQFTQVNFAESDFQTILDAITAGAQGITESVDVETLTTETDVDGTGVATPDEGAGPVAEPKLPPAKKTAARKAAPPVKKATPEPVAAVEPESTPDPEPTPEPEPEPTPEADEPVVEDPPEEAPANGKGTTDDPVILTEDQINSASSTAFAALQHVHTPEGLCMKNDFGEPCGSEPTPEPAKPKAAAQPTAAVTNCGDQPPSLAGKFPAKDGCGKVLTPENRDKAQLSIVKFKTYLCNDCFGQHQAA